MLKLDILLNNDHLINISRYQTLLVDYVRFCRYLVLLEIAAMITRSVFLSTRPSCGLCSVTTVILSGWSPPHEFHLARDWPLSEPDI